MIENSNSPTWDAALFVSKPSTAGRLAGGLGAGAHDQMNLKRRMFPLGALWVHGGLDAVGVRIGDVLVRAGGDIFWLFLGGTRIVLLYCPV